jgi:hypothetical protein
LAVLLVWAPLISAASDTLQGSGIKHTQQIETQGPEKDSDGGKGPSDPKQPSAGAASASATPESYNYQGTFNYYSTKPATPESGWETFSEKASLLFAFLVMVFTGALVRTSWLQWKAIRAQVTLMQAQFDQWIDLDWRCAERTHDLKIWVDLVNPTGFPMKFTEGYIAVAEDKRDFGPDVLSPRSPKSINFDISITDNDYGPINRPVTAHFTHLHRITKTPIPDRWEGELKCEWWRPDRSWHVKFTRFGNTPARHP